MLLLFLASGRPAKAADIVSYVIGIPLLPGIGFVSIFWGSWQALHEGQIAFVPPISILVDSAIIFAVWELVRRVGEPEADAHITLNLDR